MRILIIKTSSLGDLVHMFPAVSDMHKSSPRARIDWVAEESFAELPGWHPAVGSVIPVALRRWKHAPAGSATWSELRASIAALRRESYDLVIDAQGLLKSAVIARCARGMRWGYDSRSIREPLASVFYQQRAAVSLHQHAIIRNRLLCAQVLGYDITALPLDYGLNLDAAVAPSLALHHPYVMAFHGTSRADKEWPEQHWVAFAHAMQQHRLQLLLPWGSAVEKSRAHRIAAAADNSVVLPRLTLTQIAALIRDARGVIGMDTGLIHAAAALKRPVLALYPATRPELTGALAQQGGAEVVNLAARDVENADAVARRFLRMI
jgi:heptosyltransferase I